MHHHLRHRVVIGTLCTIAMLFAGANTASADTSPEPDPVADTIDPGGTTASDEGDGIMDIDLPDDWVETVPDDLLNQPNPEPGIAFTVGVGTDGHYCGSFYIKHISYTFNYDGDHDYTRIHVQVTRRYLYLGGATLGLAGEAWKAVQKCMRSGGPHSIHVRSWAAMEDQFLCHAGAAASSLLIAREIGTSWDLEGHRYPTNNPYTWFTTRCNR